MVNFFFIPTENPPDLSPCQWSSTFFESWVTVTHVYYRNRKPCVQAVQIRRVFRNGTGSRFLPLVRVNTFGANLCQFISEYVTLFFATQADEITESLFFAKTHRIRKAGGQTCRLRHKTPASDDYVPFILCRKVGFSV